MEVRRRQRCTYVTARQKNKLNELIIKHPELISCKVTQDFTHKDSQKLWQNIANECNAIPGAKKTWRQWRKTWHDIRSKTKKKQEKTNGGYPLSHATELQSVAEQEAKDVQSLSSTENYQEIPEFISFNDFQPPIFNEQISLPISESVVPSETKLFNTKQKNSSRLKLKKHESMKTDTCIFHCDVLAVQEEKKIRIKEDYINFKKDYLRQKLVLLKEQTEALKSLAKVLTK